MAIIIDRLEIDYILYGNNLVRIYGPYWDRNNLDRQYIILYYFGKNNTKTVSYPKFLMERFLGRRLVEPETVDHIDGNYHNNEQSNLRILSRSENISAYHTNKKVVRYRTFICLICEEPFQSYNPKAKYCSNACRHNGHKGFNQYTKKPH